ncbi:MAG: Mfa1 fimbrilin C-terminal domain-containing protein, partial [Muribaculaceae bacterium]|nr:Mfa1 fimbrilin C-terminal domain-containing protein [Muribaculaceae bacterium]
PKDAAYFQVYINLPNARESRSQTAQPDNGNSASNTGVEIGKDYENSVNDVIVLLASPDSYNFIAAANVNAGDLSPIQANNSQYRVLSKFSKTQLSGYYGESGTIENTKATVFIFCNPTNELYDLIFGTENTDGIKEGTNSWINSIGTVTSGSPIWSNNNFLMGNSKITTRDLPGNLSDWDYFTSEDKAFDLSGNNEVDGKFIDNSGGKEYNPIQVERAAARFDFRDGSEDGVVVNGIKNGLGNFTYNVMNYESFDENNEAIRTPVLNIQLQKMSLVNMNNNYYFLRHVSPTGTLQDAKICEPEKPWILAGAGGYEPNSGNYVVDADEEWKTRTINAWSSLNKPTETPFDKHFIYPLFRNDGSIDNTDLINDKWSTSAVATVVGQELDNEDFWNNKGEYQRYHIWRYATENTIAGVDNECNGVSTGVVFKGILQVAAGAENIDDENIQQIVATINKKDLDKNNPYKNPILYLFSGSLYATWTNLENAAVQAAMPECKWVPAHVDESGVEVEGRYELESINRSNSTYKAVFGAGGFGKATLRLPQINPETNLPYELNHPDANKGGMANYEVLDPLAGDDNSPNAAWHAWDKADKPADGTVKDNFKSKVTGAGITIYQTSVDPSYGVGYYCYYYYWNRHNDNENNGVMYPMEFAVVRNNVYKLAVTKISRLGHPRISENDPEPPTPDTPDESEDVYLTVTTEVLPWVVRVNDIEF